MKKRTVILVNPPADHYLGMKGGVGMKAVDTQRIPPLNILILAAAIKQAGLPVEIIVKDYLVDHYQPEEFANVIQSVKPLMVGLTSFSTSIYDLLKMSAVVKGTDPSVKVIVGGPHASLFPKETIAHEYVDYVCAGDGEKAITMLIPALMEERNLNHIPNLWTKSGEGIRPPSVFDVVSLDNGPLVLPELNYLRLKGYSHPFLYNGTGLIPILSGRGCPFACTFCNSASKKPALRTPEEVAAEIEQHVKVSGVRNVFFIDDTFNLSLKRFYRMSEEILKRNIKISWAFRGRVDNINDETIRIAKASGLEHITFGVEDVSDEGLRLLKKGVTINDALNAFAVCNKFNVKASANFIIGLPHNQGKETAESLFQFIEKLNPVTIQTSVLMLIPGSELYGEAVKRGVITGREWAEYAQNPFQEWYVPGWEENSTLSEQFKIFISVNNKFYLRPRYLLSRMLETRNLREFFGKAKVGLNLLKYMK